MKGKLLEGSYSCVQNRFKSVNTDIFTVLLVLIIAFLSNSNVEGQCPSGRKWEIDIVFAHQDCNKFYKCFEGKPIEVICPMELYFSLRYWRCDWKENVNCGGRNIPEQIDFMDDNIVNHSEETEDPDNNDEELDNDDDIENVDDGRELEAIRTGLELFRNGCPTDPNISWQISHETDCNQFYVCRYGIKLERRCPPYLHFNKRLQLCDWPRVAGCAN